MTEVVVRKSHGTNSYSTRPNFTTFMKPDTNAGGTDVAIWKSKQLRKQMHMPSLFFRKDIDSLINAGHRVPQPSGFSKYNDRAGAWPGTWMATPPGRLHEPTILDPCSAFMSPAGDVTEKTGHTRILNYRGILDKPNNISPPQERHTIRKGCKAVYPQLDRMSENDPGSSQPWNSQLVKDESVRAHLGGWTSEKDPRKGEERLNSFSGNSQAQDAKEIKEKLVNKFRYTSSTQSAFEDVPWDNMLPPRVWPPITTFEKHGPNHGFVKNQLDGTKEKTAEWQALGNTWDRFQTRSNVWKDNQMDVNFVAPLPRANQIPGYSGSIGGENHLQIDDQKMPFRPFTTMRSEIPAYAPTSYRPNIPGYTGSSYYRSTSVPLLYSQHKPGEPIHAQRLSSCCKTVHRTYPTITNGPENTRETPTTMFTSSDNPCTPPKKKVAFA